MDTNLTVSIILEVIAGIVAVVGGVKAVEYIVKKINDKHDKNQQIDTQEDEIKKCNNRIDSLETKVDGIVNVYEEKIASHKSEVNSSLQDIKDEQCMLTYCMMATLDGLHQLGANGKVTDAREKLDKFMNKQAHDMK